MVVDATRENLNINRFNCEKEENIIVQGDMIVPDAKPDILNTINTTGNICIYKKEVMDGKVRIEGSVNVYIMYLADNSENNVRGLNTSLDFSETVVIPEAKDNCDSDIKLKIRNIECRVLNGRKISLKTQVETKIKIYSNEEIDLINQINNSNVECLEKSISLNSLVGKGTTKSYVKENITVDAEDNIDEILNANINLVDKDIKISYNKILAKAEAEITLMYLTEDNRINTVTARLPVVGFVDMEGIKEEDICDINFEMKNLVIKLNSVEEHSIYVEIEYEISCISYQSKIVNIIEDLYCLNGNVNLNKNDIVTISNKTNRKEICEIREKISVPEINENNLICINCVPNINKENVLNSKIVYEGDIELNILFRDNSSVGVNINRVTVPFEFKIDNISDGENINLQTRVELKNQDCKVVSNGEISCNIDLVFDVSMNKNLKLSVINNIEITDEDNIEDYSVIIYIVKRGDTLWEIAKRFKSTVRDIAKVNGIENPDKINIGDKLYIPKYNITIQNTEQANLSMSYA